MSKPLLRRIFNYVTLGTAALGSILAFYSYRDAVNASNFREVTINEGAVDIFFRFPETPQMGFLPINRNEIFKTKYLGANFDNLRGKVHYWMSSYNEDCRLPLEQCYADLEGEISFEDAQKITGLEPTVLSVYSVSRSIVGPYHLSPEEVNELLGRKYENSYSPFFLGVSSSIISLLLFKFYAKANQIEK